MKQVIGLTGPTGSGKSLVAARFAAAGYLVIDADVVAREVVRPGSELLPRLAEAFGPAILRADGTLDRRALASLAFASPEATARLNAILHPPIRAAIAAAIERAGERPVLLDAPQLFEGECDALCDRVVGVLADRAIRLARICARDGLTREEAERRMSAQPDDAFYLARCDRILYNNDDPSALAAATDRLISEIREDTHE